MAFSIELSEPADARGSPSSSRPFGGTAEAGVDFKEQNGIMVIESGVTKAALEVDM